MKKISIILGVIILAAVAIYTSFIFTIHSVIPDVIYRSAQLSGDCLQKNIDRYHFKSIINLRGEDKKEEWYQTESKIARENNVTLYNIRLSAYKYPVASQVDDLVKVLQTAKKPVLIHCQAGADRSGMASALALSVLKNAPLKEMKEQYSWKYFVNPFRSNTCGKLFFSAYEQFLHKTGRPHRRSTLLSWIQNKYVDYKGNIEFVIECANQERFRTSKSDEDRHSVTIQSGSDEISLAGWAFDYRKKSPVSYFGISIDSKHYTSAKFSIDRPDVAEVYQLKKTDFDNYRFGWTATINTKGLSKGCYPISLQVKNGDKSFHQIDDTAYDLCIE